MAKDAASSRTSSGKGSKALARTGTGGVQLVRIEPTYPGAASGEHPVTELLASNQGALSPFGDDLAFPLPVDVIQYAHPTALPNR